MILAIDPGGTTGVAAYYPAQVSTDFFEVPGGYIGFVDWFWENGMNYGLQQVICESFIPRPGARSMQYDALYIIGYLAMHLHRDGTPFKLQSPAQAKSFATNPKLKAAGLYPVGQGHAQDAARHLLVHLVHSDPQGIIARRVAEGLGL